MKTQLNLRIISTFAQNPADPYLHVFNVWVQCRIVFLPLPVHTHANGSR